MFIYSLEISEATGADCLLYLKSSGGTKYVYKSPSVEFDKENLRRPGKEKEEGTTQPTDNEETPGPSFCFSPKRKTSAQTQTAESSFSSVTDTILCRKCGEGRKETKAMWAVPMLLILAGSNRPAILGTCFTHWNHRDI
ncbi:uncharacterized protein LOC134265032 [Saccostrea cucullata]|uniref:uncharacterized protein LOC134265032 n=1 Tax=Saccostrea cuccullata TaxID=36930 RepID=UPI002ED56816